VYCPAIAIFRPVQTKIPKFGIVLVLVVVLVLGALGFRDRKETDVLQLICSVSLMDEDYDEHDSSNSVFRLNENLVTPLTGSYSAA